MRRTLIGTMLLALILITGSRESGAQITFSTGTPQLITSCQAQNNTASASLKGVVPDPFCCASNPLGRMACLQQNAELIRKINDSIMLNIRTDLEIGGICNFGGQGDPGGCPLHGGPPTLATSEDDVECQVNAFGAREKVIESYATTLKNFAQSNCN